MGDKLFTPSFYKHSELSEFVDFVFFVNGHAYKVHRVVFACKKNKIVFFCLRTVFNAFFLASARSAFFARIFKSHPKEFTIDDVSENIFSEVVKFVYSDIVDVTETSEMELIAAGKKFELKGLTRQVHLYQNLKNNPLQVKEMEELRLKFEEAKYLHDKAKERLSIKNPFNRVPARYY